VRLPNVPWTFGGRWTLRYCAGCTFRGGVECTIDGMVVCALNDALSFFLFLHQEVNHVDILVEVSAVARDMNRDH
jgi:hypothetical protein